MKKSLFILAPILTFALTFVIISSVSVSYSASEKYYYVRRNMLSHHFIKNNTNNTASGTILIKTGTASSTVDGESTIVYCAEQGVNEVNKGKIKYPLNDKNITINGKDKLAVFMQYIYPYITLTELKNYLKDNTIGIGSDYATYNFDELDAQESMTAAQAAIWNAIKSTDKFVYNKTDDISNSQARFKNFGKDGVVDIYWQKCSGYNIGTGKHATILNAEDASWYDNDGCAETGNFYKYVSSYKKERNAVANRINTLIKWYRDLPTKQLSNLLEEYTEFSIASKNYSHENGTLTLNVSINSGGDSYEIEFVDYNGNVLLENQQIIGSQNNNSFQISNLPLDTTGIRANIKANKKNNKSIFYYKGSGQDWIGIDSGVEPYDVTLNIQNDGTGKIIVYKVGDKAFNVNVDMSKNEIDNSICANNSCLSGASFVLYASDKSTVIDSFISNNSEPNTIMGLVDGVYYLKEEEPKYGYSMYEYGKAPVDAEGFIPITISSGNTASIMVNNEPNKICFTKVDSSTNEKLNGANLRIIDALGGTYEEFTTSKQQEEYCIEKSLDSGYYYLVEDKAPINYVKSNTIYKFAVGRFDPNDIVVDLENSILVNSPNNLVTISNTPGTVLSKSDFSTGNCLAGAQLTIYNANNQKVDQWISSCENGEDTHPISLGKGTYTLKEDQAPIGYATAEEITFTIDENGKVDKSLNMKDKQIEVCIAKVSRDSDEPLIGAELEIYDSNNRLYDKFTSDNIEYCMYRVPVGIYTIKETKAPNGYKLTNDVMKIEVKDTMKVQKFEFFNEIKVPKTDLNKSYIVIIIASIFAIFGIGLVSYYAYNKYH